MTETTRAMIEGGLKSIRVRLQSETQSPESEGSDIFEGVELGDEACFHIIGGLYFYVPGLTEEQ